MTVTQPGEWTRRTWWLVAAGVAAVLAVAGIVIAIAAGSGDDDDGEAAAAVTSVTASPGTSATVSASPAGSATAEPTAGTATTTAAPSSETSPGASATGEATPTAPATPEPTPTPGPAYIPLSLEVIPQLSGVAVCADEDAPYRVADGEDIREGELREGMNFLPGPIRGDAEIEVWLAPMETDAIRFVAVFDSLEQKWRIWPEEFTEDEIQHGAGTPDSALRPLCE